MTDSRTRSYISGRFSDYYRGGGLTLPPAADQREWGVETWDEDLTRGLTMQDIDDLPEYLAHERPKRALVSTSTYENPDDPNADARTGSDLVFEMSAPLLNESAFATCLDRLGDFISRLTDDILTYTDVTVIYDGNTSFYVVVRDDSARQLDETARDELLSYLTDDPDLDTMLPDGVGAGLDQSHVLSTADADYSRAYAEVIEFFEELRELDPEDAQERLQGFDGVGEKRSEKAFKTINEDSGVVWFGNFSPNSAVKTVAETYLDQKDDDPDLGVSLVESDKFVPCPGTLNGQTGLEVKRLNVDGLDDFAPLSDAVPEKFKEHGIQIELDDSVSAVLNGEEFELSEPETSVTVPEYLGIHLIARGLASKAAE